MSLEELLNSVIDPETSNSIVELGFIRKVEEVGKKVMITLSPPTFWCSPTFLYMILEDLRGKLLSRYEEVRIEIVGHHDSERLTRCINLGLKFEECYKDQGVNGHYEDLKSYFYERLNRGIRPKRRLDYTTSLSLTLNGELCKLLSIERIKSEGKK